MQSLCFHPCARSFLLATVLLGAIALFTTSVLSAMGNLMQIRRMDPDPVGSTAHEYSFVGEDYPRYYPLSIRDVLLVPENTVHYGITGRDADEEWKSIFPPGQGFVWLGRERRIFGLALYHQMHCLDLIRSAIGKQNYTKHIHHCFNYLRQAILCDADMTIEPGVPRLGSKVVRLGVERTCKDWTQVYAMAKEGFEAGLKS